MAVHNLVVHDVLTFSETPGVSAVRANVREHWTRWIVASVAKHFNDRRRGLTMFLEGDDHRNENQKDWIEVRTDGPFIREPSKGFYEIQIEVNVMIASSKDDNDIFKHYRNVGGINQAFLDPIQLLKLGTGIDDDQSLLGCFVLIRSFDQREALRVCHFGQLDASTPLMRSSIEGHYHLQLHG